MLCSSFHQSVSPAIGAFRQTIAWPVQLVCAVQGIVYSGKCAGWGTYCEAFSVQWTVCTLHNTVCSMLWTSARLYTSHVMPYISYRMYTVCVYSVYKACVKRGCKIQGKMSIVEDEDNVSNAQFFGFMIYIQSFDISIQMYNRCQGGCSLWQLI